MISKCQRIFNVHDKALFHYLEIRGIYRSRIQVKKMSATYGEIQTTTYNTWDEHLTLRPRSPLLQRTSWVANLCWWGWWFKTGQRGPSQRDMEMCTWLLLYLWKERQPGMIFTLSSSLACRQVMTNMGTNNTPPMCLVHNRGKTLNMNELLWTEIRWSLSHK